MAQVIIELSADERKVLAAYQKAKEADEKLRSSTGETGKAGLAASKSFADAWTAAGNQSAQSVDRLLTEMKRLGPEGKIVSGAVSDSLRTLGDGGNDAIDGIIARISSLDPEAGAAAAAAAAKIKTELEQADASTRFDNSLEELRKINPEAAKVAAKVREEMDLADAGVKFDNIIEELRKVDPAAAREAEKLRGRMKTAADGGKDVFGSFRDSALGDLKQIAVGYIGIERAIEVVVAANQKVIQTNKEIFESLKQTASGDSRLLQIATSADDFGTLRGKADELASEQGISREEARQLVFSARSENFESSLNAIAANAQVIDVTAQAGVAGQIPTLFRREGLTGEQAIDATLVGAQQSRLTFEQIGSALPQASEGAALAGATSSETISALSVLASDFKSAETAADRIKAFGTAISLDQGDDKSGRESLAGVGLVEATKRLMAMPEEQRREFLGESAEVNVAFNAMAKNLETILQRQSIIQTTVERTGTDQSITVQARRIAAEDPKLAAQREVAISENRLEIERENRRAANEGGRQQRTNVALQAAEAAGDSEFSIATGEMAGDAVSGMGLSAAAPAVTAAVSSDDALPAITSLSNPIGAVGSVFGMINLARRAGQASAVPVRDDAPITMPTEKPQQTIVAVPTPVRNDEPITAARPQPTDAPQVITQPTVAPEVVVAPVRNDAPMAMPTEKPGQTFVPVPAPVRTDAPITPIVQAEDTTAPIPLERRVTTRNGQRVTEDVNQPDPAVMKQAEAIDRMAAAIDRQNEIVAQQTGILAATEANTRPGDVEPEDFNAILNESTEEQDAR